MATTKAVKIYISYARMDRLLIEDFKKHLLPLQRRGLIELLDELEVAPGGNWNVAIDKHLNEADIILLMVSPDFLDSDYCYSKEMQRALERHMQREAHVIPIILRPVHWQDTPFSRLQVLPKDALPVTRWMDRDEAFDDIVKQISEVISSLVDVGDANLFTVATAVSRPQRQHPQKSSAKMSRRTLIIGGIATATIAAAGGLYSFFSLKSPNTNGSTPTPSPNNTLTPLPGTVLYQPDWSSGLDGWSNPQGSIGIQEWTAHDGILTCNGNLIGEPSTLLIAPPYQPPIADYSIEAEIQFLSDRTQTDLAYFGLIARNPANGAFGYLAGVNVKLNASILKEVLQASTVPVVQVAFDPGQIWHIYRLELKGNKLTFFVDGNFLYGVIDDRFLESGLVGLVSSACRLNVRGFRLLA